MRRLLSFMLMAMMAISMCAIPAKPGLTRTITLSDGTTMTARLVGDEHGHYWMGEDGKAYLTDDDQIFRQVEQATIASKAAARRHQANAQRARRLSPKKVGEFGNYTGKKKGIIILVNFNGTSFKAANNQALFNRIVNEKNFSYGNFKGSMHDYFYKQSEGKFELDFDVVGPVTVSKKASYYGANDSSGDDLHPAEMVIEALALVDNQVNFADYDWDDDGEVDQVYLIYAGKGAADGGAASTIWPHEWTLEAAAYYNNDGSGPQTYDGVTIDTYACGPELNGQTGEIAGIGTMCHEFSHCLGYPDFYDTDDSGGQGMSYWDLMDSGSYNGDSYQPAGYTSYERWVAGWKTPIELSATKAVTGMKSLQDGGEGYIIYNNNNKNEYYLLENRQLTGWDASLPGKGLLIIHVDYNKQVWENNKPNDDPSHQRMTWIPADNKYQYFTYQGSKYYTEEGMANDPFPNGSVNSFSKSTTPAAKLWNKNSDGTYYLDSSVENITQNSDGTISFNFIGLSNVDTPTFSPAAGTYTEPQSITISCATEGAEIHYTTDGSTPTATSPVFSAPFTIETTTTVKAIAIADGEESSVATARYIIRTGGADTNTFIRATSTSDLANGMRCIIACGSKSVAAGPLAGTRTIYLSSADVETDDDIITIDEGVTVFTLSGENGQFALINEDDEYLYSPEVKSMGYTSTETLWTMSNNNSGVIIGNSSAGFILYNANSPRFATYTSSPNTSMIYANIYVEYKQTAKQDVTMNFSAETATATVGMTFTQPTLTTEPDGLTVTYTSSDPTVATVDATTGEVTPLAAGTTVITATFEGNITYNSAEASYTLTVSEPQGQVTETVKYVLVDDASQLAEGEEIIIVAEDNDVYYALSTAQNKNNRSAVEVTMNDDGTITGNEETQDLTLTGETGAWYFYTGSGYLAAGSNSKNYLHTNEEQDGNSKATISITDDIAKIQFQGSYKRNLLKFNYNYGSPIFSCYGSGQQDVMIYRKVVEVTPQGLKGDVNGDHDVNLTDVTLTVDYIINNQTEGFILYNGDMDDNGEITNTDLTSIINLILNGEY